ncbi:ead/Ea22-like family protein [Escherichia coli]|uniref:ead/Ea22-like family protein n=1 Tax=Escherichia coli TaxID=562 RepID=UPI000CFBD676|nr:ead/Ea22-like family protein [Escherichia coli]
MTKYERLRKAATKATCGSWSLDYGDDFFYDGDALICREIVGYLPICRVEGAHPESGFEEGFIKEQQHNAEFIAAANPTAVLELLDELEAAEKRIAELESRKVGLPVASCTVEDGEMCIDGFSEYVGHSLPDGVHDLYTAPPAPAVPAVLERLRAIVADPRALPRRKEWVSGQQYSYVLLENVEAMVDEACRDAMLERKGE